ncbi:glucose-1-phosphate cytidylyltransferase [Pedobacter endophyticus]|uniref:Glucose-1-phosphate cytidylyltransferase n=1 Tax=Pedobacter endophyticus TaxID=2789740 RepID=A0A7S9KZY4_9SPHI|nr:glucose-1-phosphate cytidylyltransferase [Pedobacter endophyticus]QPH39925.1 glucose-1-phosphate cytidylyltransferase [Pedobacter endophyticus]
MKAVILAGGLGTRISEESGVRPKPMVEIGGRPILWHIMKIYSCYGINEFIVCCGYKGHVIKEYFANYCLNNSDVTFNMQDNSMEVHKNETEPWKVTLVHTGLSTMTGGRLKRVQKYVGNETFCMTYGDGLSDVNITESINLHKATGSYATLTAVQQPGRFGVFNLGENENFVNSFQEKPDGSEMPWINGGFFVLEPEVFNYIEDDDAVWEKESMEMLAREGQLSAYRHTGFWQPMDTLRDKTFLEDLWHKGQAPWHEESLMQNIANAAKVPTEQV